MPETVAENDEERAEVPDEALAGKRSARIWKA